MRLLDDDELDQTVLTAPVGICLVRADDFAVEAANPAFAGILRTYPEALIGRFYPGVFAEARPKQEAALARVIESGLPDRADDLELPRQGREETTLANFVYVPVKNAAGTVRKIAVWLLESTKQAAQRDDAAKKAFREEHDRLHSYFMQAPAGICILRGPELVYELVNPAYAQFLPGRSLLGRPIFEALPELVGTPLQEILQAVYRDGEPCEMHELLVPIAEYEGGPMQDRYFSFSYQPWRDEQNRVDGILAIAFDVSGMTKVQHELRKAREQADQQKRVYEAITSGTPDLVYVWDLDYRFTYANRALLSMWGKTWETAIGKGLRENGYEEWHAAMHEREIDHVIATGQSVRGEVAFPHAVLGKRIYDYILIPVLNDRGEVEAVAGTTRDVTERKQMEQALAQSSEELQAINEELAASNEEQAASNEELISINKELEWLNQQVIDARQKIEEREIALRLAISASNFGTWFIHSGTREFVTDARLKELFGFHAHEEISIEQALAQISDEYRDFVTTKLEKAIYENGDYDVTYPVVGFHDKRLRWLRAIGNSNADPSGTFSAFTGVVMDISEQKEDEQRKNDFIGMVSHELKTPLTSLSAILQVSKAKLKNSGDPFFEGAMERANVQVKLMSSMINGFLNVSRLASAKLLIVQKTFDLNELTADRVAESTLVTPDYAIGFQAGPPAIVSADMDKIGSVITNLVSNAVKYSPENKRVDVRCEVLGNRAKVSVKDGGIGLNGNDQAKVFDRYFRVENSEMRHISGFGIGLYLSAEIIRAHGGEIGVESEMGKGSTFFFSLPLA